MEHHEHLRVISKRSFTRYTHAQRYEERYKVFNLTSFGQPPFVALSPYYPHGNIPVPGKPAGTVGHSVEGIWQGLKLFRTADGARIGVDASKWEQLQHIPQIRSHVRRVAPTGGSVIGHSWHGEDGWQEEIPLGLEGARQHIYLPAYRAAIHNSAEAQYALVELVRAARLGPVMLVDAHSNGDPNQRGKLSPVKAVVLPLLREMLGLPESPLPVPHPQPAQLQAVAAPGEGLAPASSQSIGSETESEDRSSEYHSAVPSLASI